MLRLYNYILWVIQVSCLGVILYCLSQVLHDRAVLGIAMASVILAMSLYLEHTQPDREG